LLRRTGWSGWRFDFEVVWGISKELFTDTLADVRRESFFGNSEIQETL
jgi:hypothetical protein